MKKNLPKELSEYVKERIPEKIWVGFNELGYNHKSYQLSRGKWTYNIEYVRQDDSDTRLTNKDVREIRDMQYKIDVYENFIVLLAGMVAKKDPKVVCLASDVELEQVMGGLWRNVKEIIEEYDTSKD